MPKRNPKANDQSQSHGHRVLQISLVLLRLFIIGTVAWALIQQQWVVAIQAGLLLATTYIPHWFIERPYGIGLPVEFHFTVASFLFLSIFVGTIMRLYHYLHGWDWVIHGASGIVLGFFGFMILYTLYIQKRLDMSFKLMAMFAFCVGLAGGALWEIGEFTSDTFIGTHAQFNATDTMMDLVTDALGSLVVSLVGYYYLKHPGAGPLRRFIMSFESHNPQLFKQASTKKGK